MKIVIQFMKHKISADGVFQPRAFHNLHKLPRVIPVDDQTGVHRDEVLCPNSEGERAAIVARKNQHDLIRLQFGNGPSIRSQFLLFLTRSRYAYREVVCLHTDGLLQSQLCLHISAYLRLGLSDEDTSIEQSPSCSASSVIDLRTSYCRLSMSLFSEQRRWMRFSV